MPGATEIFTVGHSTRTLVEAKRRSRPLGEEFLVLLQHYHIRNLIDIRRFPTSARFPHFKRDVLEQALLQNGLAYSWLGDMLGGYRTGGYELYTRTKEFQEGVNQVREIAARGRTAIMCAELLWFRCHRRFVADVLIREGYQVSHIIDMSMVTIHTLNK